MINNLRIGNQVVAGIYLGNTLIRKMYNGNLVVYDMSGGPTPCFEVVSTLVYASGDYVDVYCTGNSKWYKLNNLGSYEEYGIYAETDNLSSLTYYTGKLAILTTDDHEYRWNGTSWIDCGSAVTIIKSPEYLERTNNANGYVALGEYFQENTVIDFDFQMTYDRGTVVIGDYGTNDNDDWRFFVNYSDGGYSGVNYDFLSTRIQNTVSDTHARFHYEIGNYYIKNVTTGNYVAQGTAKTGFSRPNQMFLWHGEGSQFATNSDLGKVWSLKIYQNSVLTKDFIPWTDMNGNYGLYDLVSNQVFNSTGTMTGSSNVTDVPVTTYPVEYDTKVAPPNYVAYNTLEELELMECPYVGMYAIIGGSDLYKFSSSFEWEYISSVPCFEVVSDISLATGYFVDVYCTGDSKWYKKNNLSQFEEYGVYEETSNLSSLTYYTGKLAMLTTDNHEYRWNGSSWADQGAAVITSIDRLWLDKGTSVNFDYHFGNNYMMKVSFYKDTSYSSDNSVINTVSNKGPIEFSLYNYGFYYDYHQPLNSSSPQCDTGDYTARNMQQSAYQVTNTKSFAELYTGTKITLKYENGSQMHSSGSVYSSSNWYSGLYNGRINLASDSHVHISYVQVYDNNNNLIHDIHPVVKNGTLVMYDFKTDAEYTSSSAVYHKDGTYTFDYPIINYPVEYDTKVAPADNVHYDTIEELELMECPWIGMHATIGVDYVSYIYTADGWEYDEDSDWRNKYLSFIPSTSSTFSFSKAGLSYQINDGAWTSLAASTSTPTVTSSDVIRFKGSMTPDSTSGIGTFSATGDFTAKGNIMSLLYSDNFKGQTALTADYTFFNLFERNTHIVDAQKIILPATTLRLRCYSRMFMNCTNLVKAPNLPATTLASYCYAVMFQGCSSLSSDYMPTLPVMTLANNCYNNMFFGCSSLTRCPALPATSLASECYCNMFYNCTGISESPLLPATTLSSACYQGMFYGCSNLTKVTALFTTTPGSSYTGSWMSGVAASGTFYKNSSATWSSSITRGTSTVPSGWTITNYSS